MPIGCRQESAEEPGRHADSSYCLELGGKDGTVRTMLRDESELVFDAVNKNVHRWIECREPKPPLLVRRSCQVRSTDR